jgi:hypothetical protein
MWKFWTLMGPKLRGWHYKQWHHYLFYAYVVEVPRIVFPAIQAENQGMT